MCAFEENYGDSNKSGKSLDMLDPTSFDIRADDLEFFEKEVASFIPDEIFDSHAHWYDISHLQTNSEKADSFVETVVGYNMMKSSLDLWMGSRDHNGLYFPFPVKHLDFHKANRFLHEEIRKRPQSRALMMIRPNDDPDEVETKIMEKGFAGFKVYHVFANRKETFFAEQGEFLPDWAWEIANRHGLWITMHMVLPKALSDPANSKYIRQKCIQYPNARLVLAHAARGFNGNHTADAVHLIKDLDNVFFDSSAVCEPTALEAIIRATGTTRLMYGSDFPVSQIRGKAVSVGNGFMWFYSHNVDWNSWQHGQPNLVGIESLLALKQACRNLCLNDMDLERIFSTNAKQLLGISEVPSRKPVLEQYRLAKKIIPGGGNLLSKRPEMLAPDEWPAYAEQAIGCEIIDTAGNRYIDMSYNGILACILGYADPDVNAAVIRRVNMGSMTTLLSYDEVKLAQLLLEIHPWADKARFTRTGGESMAVAVRIARAATGRDKVAICGYHGWHDWYLAANLGKGGNENLTGHLLPGLEPNGVPKVLRDTALHFHYNQLSELEEIFNKHGSELAAVVMEPTRSIDPDSGFLEGIRKLCIKNGTKLIFDEISIGWRLCLGGAHLLYGVNPDIAVFAKTISNGFPMGAVIGNRLTMEAAQTSFISSAYWTEGVGPAAAVASISKMKILDVPSHLNKIGTQFLSGWRELGEKYQLPVTCGGRPEITQVGFDHTEANSLMTLFTTRMLGSGFLASSAFNPTWAHQPRHVSAFLQAAEPVFEEISEALEKNDIGKRINHKPKHTGFARLVE